MVTASAAVLSKASGRQQEEVAGHEWVVMQTVCNTHHCQPSQHIYCLMPAGFRPADEGFNTMQPSSARASVSSSDGFGSRASRHQHGDSFGGGQLSLARLLTHLLTHSLTRSLTHHITCLLVRCVCSAILHSTGRTARSLCKFVTAVTPEHCQLSCCSDVVCPSHTSSR